MSRFYENIRKGLFYGQNILTDCVFVTQLFSNEGISVWRIVWYTTHGRIMTDIHYILFPIQDKTYQI
jgi:hypothetical protein